MVSISGIRSSTGATQRGAMASSLKRGYRVFSSVKKGCAISASPIQLGAMIRARLIVATSGLLPIPALSKASYHGQNRTHCGDIHDFGRRYFVLNAFAPENSSVLQIGITTLPEIFGFDEFQEIEHFEVHY